MHKAGFIDGISMNLTKNTKTLLIEPLTIIINQMITNGIFPDILKISNVIPIYKKDDKKLLTNYRPISLLPSISKIFENLSTHCGMALLHTSETVLLSAFLRQFSKHSCLKSILITRTIMMCTRHCHPAL